MDIMELGAMGELVGGGAVLATLIYLALQVRNGNVVSQDNASHAWVQFNFDFVSICTWRDVSAFYIS